MAHLVEKMAYVGQEPWHGLGARLVPGSPLEVWLKEAGLDWTARETPVLYNNGDAIVADPSHKVLFRSDTHAILNVVSNRYRPVQPAEILEFYRDLTESAGFVLETAGSLKGGQKLWALARLPEDFSLQGVDPVRGYLLLATSYDGTLATTAQFTSVRVVCNNTLTMSVNQEYAAGVVKVSHLAQFDPQAVKAELGVAPEVVNAFRQATDTLTRIRLDAAKATEVMNRVFRTESYHAKAVVELFTQRRTPGADLATADSTAWGLVNALTYYVDHHKRARTRDSRLHSAWFGEGAVLKRRALEETLALAA